MILRTGEHFGPIEAEFRLLIEVSKQPRRLWHDRALNRLERVLIDCDDLNPLHSAASIDRRIRRALELVGKNLASPLGVEELSQAAGLSRSRFTVLFTEQTKMSPQVYIEYVRLSRAAQMLQMSAWPISRIAEEVGIPSPFYFSTRFRQRFGISPSAYRQRHSVPSSGTDRLQ
jgi:AraC-like DNA-binding protein